MFGMLAVLGLLIARAADSRTWAWLATDESAATAKQQTTARTEDNSWKETVTPGPTDEDLEEQAAALEEFMALTDGSLEPAVEEMPAYWRLFSWVQHQSIEELRKRGTDKVVFNDFLRDPQGNRGALFQMDLNVRRVLSYPAPKNSAGVKTVYEVWGWTTESKSWLFAVLVSELPPGMPVGTDVYEHVNFSGYFYKLQGYHEAGAGPRDKPLPAPLLIGRLSWRPSELRVARSQPQDWTWAWWVGGVAVVFGLLRMGLWFHGRRRAAQRQIDLAHADSPNKDRDVQRWLSEAERDPHPSYIDFHNN